MFRLRRGSRGHRLALLMFALLVAVALGSRYFARSELGYSARDASPVAPGLVLGPSSEFDRAHRELMAGGYEEAIRQFRALDGRSAGRCAACRNNVGYALMRLGLPGQAEAEFAAAASLDPTSRLYANNLDWARQGQRSGRERSQGPSVRTDESERAR